MTFQSASIALISLFYFFLPRCFSSGVILVLIFLWLSYCKGRFCGAWYFWVFGSFGLLVKMGLVYWMRFLVYFIFSSVRYSLVFVFIVAFFILFSLCLAL